MEEVSSYIPEPLFCPVCSGHRFSKATMRKRLAGLNIYDFLSLSIDDIIALIPSKYAQLSNSLALASNVGLGYLTLFQSTATLSGGEAQRVKFTAGMLPSKKKQVFLLDEPFRGVDRRNIQNIFRVLYSLVENGSSIIISEHNPFALDYCSYILELGPGNGIYGGRVTYLGETAKFRSRPGSSMAELMSQKMTI
jgi:excinuclease ABC subunit A